MTFKSAAEILTDINAMQWASQPVQQNRAKINRQFNGEPPLTDDERRANRLNTNFNWLEPTRIAANCREQMEDGMLRDSDYFTLTFHNVPPHRREFVSSQMTQFVNSVLATDEEMHYYHALESAVAQVVLHGPGPVRWPNERCCSPDVLGVDDVLVPATTLANFSNLDRFAIYREMTWAQLMDAVKSPTAGDGWNRPYAEALLRALFEKPLQTPYQGNRWLFPEKLAEDIKENASLWAASALPKLLAWEFYHRNADGDGWNRKILLDFNNISPDHVKNEFNIDRKEPQFLYEKDHYADDWTQIFYCFMGNRSNVAPFRYYTVRSIGYLLYGVCLVQNIMRCRMTDHILQQLLTWFRNVSEDDRERLEDFQLQHLGIMPDGVSIVPAGDRYAANYQLVELGLNQNRQLMAESATTFLPNLAIEDEKPAMTATESTYRQTAASTLATAVLRQLYRQADRFDRELMRRFCIKDNPDPMAKRVRKKMKEVGIPLDVLDIDEIEVRHNRVMGGGNKAVELLTSRSLFEARGAIAAAGGDPRIPVRRYILALTGDAQETDAIIPEAPKPPNSAATAANAFGVLMQGVPYPPVPGTDEVTYISTLIELMAQAMAPLEGMQSQPNAVPLSASRIAGLVNVGQHIEEHIQILAGDETEREKVRDFQRMIVQLMNELKAYGERISEQEQAQAAQGWGVDAETQGKIIAMQTLAQAKGQIALGQAQQKQQHKDAAFMADQQRRDAQTVAEIRRKDALTTAEVASKDLTTRADMVHGARNADHERQQTAMDRAQEREQSALDAEQQRQNAEKQAAAKAKKSSSE